MSTCAQEVRTHQAVQKSVTIGLIRAVGFVCITGFIRKFKKLPVLRYLDICNVLYIMAYPGHPYL